MGALDLLTRSIKAGKYGRPFYSKMDEALEALKREKGTAEEFLRELEKQPGVKKAEIEDRGIRKVLESRSRAPDAKKPITKQQMQKILYEQAPMPPVVEDVLGGKNAQYEKWRTPGGENYREILLKLPEDYLLEPYMADHFGDTPNILAHIRVQDFKSPEGKKVLLVDEVQSDWHQTGRKEGYSSPYAKRNLEVDQRLYEYAQEDKAKAKAAMEEAEAAGDTAAYEASRDKYLELVQRSMTLDSQIAKQKQAIERGVPDAPFKKNWHELAMKRVLDYAAENGYDTVAITPGAEQAKRYDLSKQVQQIMAAKEDGGVRIFARDNQGKNHDMGVHPLETLDTVIGKDLAQKVASQSKPTDIYEGVDLQVGGEGMKGFYDKILPDYLNTYGKQYGANVGEIDLITKPEKSVPQIAAPGIGHFPEPITEPAQMLKAHSFDITPQMREAIKTKGQPMYGKVSMPVLEGLAGGSGAATIGVNALTGNDEQPVQNPVHFTENPDAMLLELMQRN